MAISVVSSCGLCSALQIKKATNRQFARALANEIAQVAIQLNIEGDLANQMKFEFPDSLQEIYSGFGINLPKHHGGGGWELPMPARYVVAEDGTIVYAVVHPDYTRRPEPAETISG